MSVCPDCRYNPCQCDTIATLRAEVERLTKLDTLARDAYQGLEAEVERLKVASYPRTCWMDHEEIGHRREMGDCPLCKSMQANDRSNRRIAALEAELGNRHALTCPHHHCSTLCDCGIAELLAPPQEPPQERP